MFIVSIVIVTCHPASSRVRTNVWVSKYFPYGNNGGVTILVEGRSNFCWYRVWFSMGKGGGGASRWVCVHVRSKCIHRFASNHEHGRECLCHCL